MKNDTTLAIQYMLFASFMLASMGAVAKLLSTSLSSVEIVFFRNLFGIFLIIVSLYKYPLKQTGGKPWLLFFRGFVGFLAVMMFFYNITTISLAEAMTFSKTSPIFTAIFAYIFVKEKLSLKAWIGVFVGFIGILFITKFDGSSLQKSDWLGILSGVGAGLAYTSIRQLRKYYDNRTIVLSFMGVGTLGPLILMIIGSYYSSTTFDFLLAPFIMPQGLDWFYIALLGVVATLGQVFMTKAYSLTKAGIVGTIGYSNIVFAIGFGFILGDSFPDYFIMLGIVFIVASGVLVSRKSKKETKGLS